MSVLFADSTLDAKAGRDMPALAFAGLFLALVAALHVVRDPTSILPRTC